MTNPERKAVSDERERLIRKLEERFPDESWADLVRADAEKDETIAHRDLVIADQAGIIRGLRDAVAPVAWMSWLPNAPHVRFLGFDKPSDELGCAPLDYSAPRAAANPAPTVATREAVSDATPDRIVSAVYGAVFAAMIDGGAHVTQARLSAEKFSERARPAPTVATREADAVCPDCDGTKRISLDEFGEGPCPRCSEWIEREAVTEVIEEIRKLRSGAHERDPWRLLFEDWATRLDAALAAPPTVRAGDEG